MNYLTNLALILALISFGMFFIGGMYRATTDKGTKHNDFGRNLHLYAVRTATASLVMFFLLFVGA